MPGWEGLSYPCPLRVVLLTSPSLSQAHFIQLCQPGFFLQAGPGFLTLFREGGQTCGSLVIWLVSGSQVSMAGSVLGWVEDPSGALVSDTILTPHLCV